MKLEHAIEHKKRIMTCVEHINLAVSLAISEGLSVEMVLTEHNSINGVGGSVLSCSVLMDPANIEDLQ